MDLRDRTSYIISDVIEKHRLSNAKLADRLGCNKATINNYRRKTNSPNGEFIAAFCEKFNVNPVWFVTGKGDPYLKTEAERDQELANKIVAAAKAQTDEEQRTGDPPLADFAIYDCLRRLDEAMPPLKIFQDATSDRYDAMKEIFGDFRKAIKNSGFTIDEKILNFISYLYYYYIQEDKSGSE
jgi:transcriptional regulator with XRE-family HTH domain